MSEETYMDITPHLVRITLHRLRGQFCTPPGTSRELVQHVEAEGLARFHEWPNGHWQITPKGLNFLAENASPEREGG